MSTITRPRVGRLRIPLAVLGSLAFVVGVLTIAAPAFAAAVPIAGVVDILGNDYLLLAAFAGLAVLVVLVVLAARGLTGLDQATPPNPESVHDAPSFGHEFDEAVSEGGLRTLLGTDRQRQLRNRLRESAIATVMRAETCTRSEAREQVARGTWTDDPVAARFLAESQAVGTAQPGAGAQPGGPAQAGSTAQAGTGAQPGATTQPGGTAQAGTGAQPGGTAQAGTGAQPGGTAQAGTGAQPGTTAYNGGAAEAGGTAQAGGTARGGRSGHTPGAAGDSRPPQDADASGVLGRLKSVFGKETPFQRGARRTATEIVRLDPGENG